MKIKMADDPGAYYAWIKKVERDSAVKRQIIRERAMDALAYVPPLPPKPSFSKRLKSLWYAFKWNRHVRLFHTGSTEGLRSTSISLFGRIYHVGVNINLRHCARWGPRSFYFQLAVEDRASYKQLWAYRFNYEKPFKTFHVTPLTKGKHS